MAHIKNLVEAFKRKAKPYQMIGRCNTLRFFFTGLAAKSQIVPENCPINISIGSGLNRVSHVWWHRRVDEVSRQHPKTTARKNRRGGRRVKHWSSNWSHWKCLNYIPIIFPNIFFWWMCQLIYIPIFFPISPNFKWSFTGDATYRYQVLTTTVK